MRGDPVPDDHHVLRYVGGAHIDLDLETDEPVILGSGFISRPRDDRAISVHWLEVLAERMEDQVAAVRMLSRLGHRPTARFARLNVGRLRRHIVENDPAQTSLAVIQDPLEADTDRGYLADPSHALVHPVPDADDPAAELIGDLIAQCVLDSFPAVRA